MSYLEFDKDHPTRANEKLTVPADKSYIITFDTQDLKLRDAHVFDDALALLAFKGVLINTLDAFTASYAEGVWEIAKACEKECVKDPKGAHVLDNQRAVGLIQRAQMRLDEMINRVGDWDGKEPISTVLPYVATATKMVKEVLTDSMKETIDTKDSKPYVNGVIFEAAWRP